jgi:predicted dienelactone hydrolase
MKRLLSPDSTTSPFLILSILVFGIFGFYFETRLPKGVMLFLGTISGALAFLVLHVIFQLVGEKINKIPLVLNAAILSVFSTFYLARILGFRLPDQIYYPGVIGLVLLTMILSFSIKKIKKRSRGTAWLGILIPVLLILFGVLWLKNEGNDPYTKNLPAPFETATNNSLAAQGIKNPAQLGEYIIEKFTYGNGTDKNRKEYAEEINYKTPTIDATHLLPEWKDKKKKWRESYWGFGVKNFPLNGRVFFPKGEGPFPITLIVHGNHSMIDYSDDGYGYLGELLASQGVIAVSIDENFINGHWSGDFQGKEMPTRAWILLKHLEQWRNWNENPNHDFFQKIDMNHIMLVGHSRGGEAVSIAAAFNSLSHFPDNGKEQFDFNFGIKGVVSIAPTDYRYHRKIKMKNINYLSLQGAYDSDEVSFWGMRPYRRLKFTNEEERFKAGVYIHRANHGQFNSSWGRTDFGPPSSWLLNTQPLIPGEDQREAAKVFISAFALSVLKNDQQYLPIFNNVNTAKDWLPKNYYLTHFQDNNDLSLQNFEEDIELKNGKNGITITSQNLKIYREENLATRDGGSQENNAVILGWDYGNQINPDSIASYTLIFPDTSLLNMDTTHQLLISLATGDFKELSKNKKEKEKRKEPRLDFHLQLIDSSGHQIDIQISKVKRIAPRLQVKFTKVKSLDADWVGKDWEVHLESFALPLLDFSTLDGNFNFEKTKVIQLVFDICKYGVLVVDDIGISKERLN